MLTIAIAKGRLQQDALELFARAGVRVNEESLASRRLAVEDERGRYRFIFVKPADVPVYVEHGIADCGVVGRDVLLETGSDVLQPLDLKIGCCRIAGAAKQDSNRARRRVLHVATTYPRVTSAHFSARAVPAEIIVLPGPVHLSPHLRRAHSIVASR